MAADAPEEHERPGQPHRPRATAVRQRPIQRRAQVLALGVELREALPLPRPAELGLEPLCQPEVVASVGLAHPRRLVGLLEPYGGVGSDRLEQAVARR
jgi:hypothetical protein